MLNDKDIEELMNNIFGSVEIEDPEFAFRMLKKALRQAHLEGIEQGKLEGILKEKRRSIQLVKRILKEAMKEVKSQNE